MLLNGKNDYLLKKWRMKMWEKCCPGSRKLSQEEMSKWISECCGTEDVSDPDSEQDLFSNCCGQHAKRSKEEKENERE